MRLKINILILACIGCMPLQAQEAYTLEQCKRLALENNAKAQNGQLSVEMAVQARKEAFTNYFPSVSAIGMGFKATKPMMSMDMGGGNVMEMLDNGIIGGVSASLPLYAGGQIVNGNKLAGEAVKVSLLQKRMSDDEVLLETEQYFWQIISLTEKLKTVANAETRLDRIRSDVDAAVRAGLTTRNDLLRVELEQNKLASNKLQVKNGLRLVKMGLAQHIGVSVDSFGVAHPSLDLLPSPNEMNTDHADAMSQRAEYQLSEKNVDITGLQLKMKCGELLPTLAVGAGYNYFNFDHGSHFAMKDDFGMGFVTLSIPLSGWWSGSHAVKKKKLEVGIAENDHRQTAQLLLLQMQTIRNELDEAYQQVLIARQSIGVAEENVRLNEDFYTAGTVILSDLLDAQSLLQQSRDQYTEASTGYRMKLSQYRQVTGRSDH